MRPEEAKHIIGHEQAIRILKKSLATGRIFPTWIFSGPFGIGKSTLAYNFAKSLLSESKDLTFSSDVHNMVINKIHPDFFLLEPVTSSVSIDDSRALISKIKKTPMLSKWRVVIIEAADKLNKNIYNSLLKILEEPPKNTVIILICDKIGLIPRTLTSRSDQLFLSPLRSSDVKKALNNFGIQSADRLSKLSGGSIGFAIYLNENNGLEIYDKLLNVFSPPYNYKKFIIYFIENNVSTHFYIVKNVLTNILTVYVELLVDIDLDFDYETTKVLKAFIKNRPPISKEFEIKKVTEVISFLHKIDEYMLDRTSVLFAVFEELLDR